MESPTEPHGRGGLRALAMVGLLGPIVYVVAVVVGGALWPGYSPYAETISTLTSQGAPNQWLLQPLFVVYNVSLLALAVGLHLGIRRHRLGTLGPAFLAAAGASGILLAFFPQGPWNDPLRGTGVAHTVIAGLDALCFLLAMGFLWGRLRLDPRWSGFDRFTAGMLGVGILLGGFGAASITAPYAGVVERLSIGCFLLWTELLAAGLWSRGLTNPGAAGPDAAERDGSSPAPSSRATSPISP